MKRDFSSVSRQKLLNAVTSVESGQGGNFTDWNGTSRFNISYYICQMNNYHNKVITKNNESKQKINGAFDKAITEDKSIATEISSWRSSAERWKRYMEELNRVVSPEKGNFTSQYMFGTLNNILGEIEASKLERIKQYALGEINIIGEYEAILLEEFTSKPPYKMSEAELILLEKLMFADETFAKVYCSRHFSSNVISGNGDVTTLFENVLKEFEQLFYEQHISVLHHEKGNKDDISISGNSFLKEIASILEGAGEIGENKELKLSSSVTKYIAEVLKVLESDKPVSGVDVTSSILSLFKSFASTEVGVYNFWEKKLDPFNAFRFSEKFGNSMMSLKTLGNGAGVLKEGIEFFKNLQNTDNSNFEKAAQGIDFSGTLAEMVGNIYLTSLSNTKSLRVVIDQAGKRNQILVTKGPEIKYATSTNVAKKMKNVGAGITIGKSIVSTISAGVRRADDVQKDGEVTMKDVGSVGIYASVSGLSELVSGVTFDIIDFNAEEVSEELETGVGEFLKSNDWKAKYLKDQSNPWIVRAALSGVAAAEMVVDKADQIVWDTAIGIIDNTVKGAIYVGNAMKAAGNFTAEWLTNIWK